MLHSQLMWLVKTAESCWVRLEVSLLAYTVLYSTVDYPNALRKPHRQAYHIAPPPPSSGTTLDLEFLFLPITATKASPAESEQMMPLLRHLVCHSVQPVAP